jgi:hypothetical protein
MPQIYRNAYLTIAASSSSSTTESYLNRGVTKIPEFVKPIQFEVRSLQGDIVNLFAVPENKTSRHKWPDSSEYPDPLIQRGWTLQERLLSTRMISFGIGELEWICGTVTTCECAAGSGTNPWNESHGLNISAHAIGARDRALMFWCAQLSLYSKRTHTYGRDKLPAISGLARVLAPKIGSRYLAGLWEDDLPRGLAWEWKWDGTHSHRISKSYRAPSWSWASVDGEFRYPHIRGLVPLLKAYGGQTTPKDNDPYGEISEGEIKVQAAIFPVVLYYEREVEWRVDPPRPQPDSAHGFGNKLGVSLDGMLKIHSASSLEGRRNTVL